MAKSDLKLNTFYTNPQQDIQTKFTKANERQTRHVISQSLQIIQKNVEICPVEVTSQKVPIGKMVYHCIIT